MRNFFWCRGLVRAWFSPSTFLGLRLPNKACLLSLKCLSSVGTHHWCFSFSVLKVRHKELFSFTITVFLEVAETSFLVEVGSRFVRFFLLSLCRFTAELKALWESLFFYAGSFPFLDPCIPFLGPIDFDFAVHRSNHSLTVFVLVSIMHLQEMVFGCFLCIIVLSCFFRRWVSYYVTVLANHNTVDFWVADNHSLLKALFSFLLCTFCLLWSRKNFGKLVWVLLVFDLRRKLLFFWWHCNYIGRIAFVVNFNLIFLGLICHSDFGCLELRLWIRELNLSFLDEFSFCDGLLIQILQQHVKLFDLVITFLFQVFAWNRFSLLISLFEHLQVSLQVGDSLLVWLLNWLLLDLMKRLNLVQFFKIILFSILLFLLKRIGHLLAQDKIVHALFFQLKFEHLKFFLPLACLFFFWLLNRLRLISFWNHYQSLLLVSNRLESLLSRTRSRLRLSDQVILFNVAESIFGTKVLKWLVVLLMIGNEHLQLFDDLLFWLLNLLLFYLVKRFNLFQFIKIILSSVLLFLLKRIRHLLAQVDTIHALFFQLRFELLKFLLPLAWFFLVRCLSVYCCLLMIGNEQLQVRDSLLVWLLNLFLFHLVKRLNLVQLFKIILFRILFFLLFFLKSVGNLLAQVKIIQTLFF